MSKDIIYREDAIKALGNEPMVWTLEDEYTMGQRSQWRADVTAIESMPSADRPQAEWRDVDGNFVPLDEDGCTTASAWCSNCGEGLTGSDEYWTSGRFCPNCGYQMRKE